MKSKRPSRKQMRSLCGELHPQDGVDPRDEAKQPHSSGRPDRKTLQLCGQVAKALSYVLAGECGDDTLRNLMVLEVAPAPNASRLMVTVQHGGLGEPPEPMAILECLARSAGKIRCEVAAAITRKRAPELVYRVETRAAPQQPD